MKNIKENIIGAVAILAFLGVLFLGLKSPEQVVVQNDSAPFGAISNTNAPAAGSTLANGQLLPNPSVFDYTVHRQFLYFDKALGFGYTSGNPVLEQSGGRFSLTAATTTPCAIQSPFTTATSTFNFKVTVTTATSSAGEFVIATSSTAFSTTTGAVANFTIPASQQGTWAFSGTTTSGTTGVVAPSGWVVFGTTNGSSVGYGYTLGGTCQAIFTTAS